MGQFTAPVDPPAKHFELKSGATAEEAREVATALAACTGETHRVQSAGPATNWFALAATFLASPPGQAMLSVIQGLVERGLLVAVPLVAAPAPNMGTLKAEVGPAPLASKI